MFVPIEEKLGILFSFPVAQFLCMDAQVVPNIKKKIRTIRRSGQLIGNKNKQIFHCLDVLICKVAKQNSKVAGLK